MKQWFGKPVANETATSWRKFIFLKRGTNESVESFLLRLETAETELKCSNINLSSLNLAIHVLETINLNESQKRNIVCNVKFEDNPDVYEDLKKAVKLLEVSLVKADDEAPENSEEVMYGDNKNTQRNSRSFSKGSKFKSKGEYRKQDNKYDKSGRHRSGSSHRSSSRT